MSSPSSAADRRATVARATRERRHDGFAMRPSKICSTWGPGRPSASAIWATDRHGPPAL
jgi:hypothetical protein